LNGVHGVLDVAVTIVDIDQNRHIAGRDDVAHRRRDVGEALEADVGHAIARTGDRETADEHGVESGPLDQQRAQRIVGAGNDEQSPLRDGSLERLAETSSTAHGDLLMARQRWPYRRLPARYDRPTWCACAAHDYHGRIAHGSAAQAGRISDEMGAR
jgi:hypothetical protein